MDENLGFQSGLSRPGLNPPSVQFENGFCEASSELIRGGLGAYGKRICGSSSQYVQSNVSFIKPCTDFGTEIRNYRLIPHLQRWMITSCGMMF